MSRNRLVIVIILLSIVACALTYTALTRGDQQQAPVGVTTKQQTVDAPRDAQKSTTPGEYAAYDAAKLSGTKGTILLFFHAPWCPQCRAIDQSIQNEGVPEGVTVYKVDYDSQQSLRQKYGVTLQTTFVKVDSNGEKISSYVAYQEPTFDSVKRELLP